MSNRTRTPRPKRHYSERFRGPNLLVERWSNAKCGHLAFHAGQGKSSTEISRILNDGTSAETIRSIVKKWRLPMTFSNNGFIIVKLSADKRGKLAKKAATLGITSEQLLKAVCDSVIADDLYTAVLDEG